MHTDRNDAGHLVRKMSNIKRREIALAKLRSRPRVLSAPLDYIPMSAPEPVPVAPLIAGGTLVVLAATFAAWGVL